MPKGSASARGRKRATDVYEDDGFVVADDDGPESKQPRKGRSAGTQRDDEGNEFLEISAKRRVAVSDFRGKPMVSIREYYEKDGKDLPGKKVASPSLSTKYSALVELLPEVETALSKKGESVKRSVYDGLSVKDNRDSDEDEADDVGKKNFEATSDEDAD
ncbi:putative RNA polymerase II transcriptional coactivator [Macrophomina phaseolina]|uniref:RNA polymerase II transcriptional coactivator n=1 Tax=Macrophomina phaseolina TaxID=35725 RepID=A0ABQ8FT05_9PEZI|nr:putative RNA polymerase II transcriptional coactivator [Macrophomina phaseolina]